MDILKNTQSNPVVAPIDTYANTKAKLKNKDNKDKIIILYAMKEHVVPHMTGKDYAYQCGMP